MSIVIFKNKKTQKAQWRVCILVIVMVVSIGIMGFFGVKALERTLPKEPPKVDEEILQRVILSAYAQPFEKGENILFRKTSCGRDLSSNRDYLEYDYEYSMDGILHTGRLTACYEYRNRKWRLVSIGVTNLNKK